MIAIPHKKVLVLGGQFKSGLVFFEHDGAFKGSPDVLTGSVGICPQQSSPTPANSFSHFYLHLHANLLDCQLDFLTIHTDLKRRGQFNGRAIVEHAFLNCVQLIRFDLRRGEVTCDVAMKKKGYVEMSGTSLHPDLLETHFTLKR